MLMPVAAVYSAQHLYRSLSEVQVEREEEISASPFSRPEQEVAQTPAELLFAVRCQPLSSYYPDRTPVTSASQQSHEVHY